MEQNNAIWTSLLKTVLDMPGIRVNTSLLKTVLDMPGIRVNRDEFLKDKLEKFCPSDKRDYKLKCVK